MVRLDIVAEATEAHERALGLAREMTASKTPFLEVAECRIPTRLNSTTGEEELRT